MLHIKKKMGCIPEMIEITTHTWITIDLVYVVTHLAVQQRPEVDKLVGRIAAMAFTASSCSPFVKTRPSAPRLPARITCVRATQQKCVHTAQAKPVQDAKLSATQLTGVAGLLVPMMLSSPALAATPDGEHLTKGTLVSLIHPLLMDFLLLATLRAGYLGWQWRRTRTIPEELKQLKQQLPPKDEQGNRPVTKLDGRIAALEEQRKLMSKKEYKGRHHNWGGLIMGLGTATAVAGPVNTYLRSGKLFPGPHLYAGAAIVTLWAGAGAMVPLMAKGNNTARTAHIAMNLTNLGLFAWQVPTGLEIVGKVLQFTSLP